MPGNRNNVDVSATKKKKPRTPPTPELKAFGKRLRKYREDHLLDQMAVAAALGVAQARISEWENGWAEPEGPHQRALADLFGVSTEDFWGRNRSSESAEGDVLPDQLKDVISSEEWVKLPPKIRRGLVLQMSVADLHRDDVHFLISMLKRGHSAYNTRKGDH